MKNYTDDELDAFLGASGAQATQIPEVEDDIDAPIPEIDEYSDDELDAFLGTPKVSATLGTAIEVAKSYDPKVEARKLQLSRELGTSPALIGDVTKAEKEAQRNKDYTAEDLAAMAPGLAKALENPTVARMAQTSLNSLAEMGQGLRNLGGAVGAAAYTANAATYGLLRATSESMFLPDEVGAALGKKAAEQSANAAALRPASTNIVQRGVYGGIESAATTVMTIPAAIMSSNPIRVLVAIPTLITGGGAYNEARDAGKSVLESLRYMVTQGGIEGLTEVAPGLSILKGMTGKTGLGDALKDFLVKDIPNEQLAAHAQDLDTWITLNPTKPFEEFMAERPEVAAEVLIATIVGGTATVGAAKSIGAVTERAQQARSNSAVKKHEALKNLNEAYANNELKKLDVQTFHDVIAKMTDEEGVTKEVFVDAQEFINVITAAKVDIAELRKSIPSVFKQLDEVGQAQGDLSISVADYATYLAGTPLGDSLLEHVKTDTNPDSMTYAQAKAYETARPGMEAEAAKLAEVQATPVATREEFDIQRQEVDKLTTEALSKDRREANSSSRRKAVEAELARIVDAQGGVPPTAEERQQIVERVKAIDAKALTDGPVLTDAERRATILTPEQEAIDAAIPPQDRRVDIEKRKAVALAMAEQVKQAGGVAPTRAEIDALIASSTDPEPTADTYEAYLSAHPNKAAVRNLRVAAVKKSIQSELDTSGRFSKEVSEANSIPIVNFYVSQADRLGITPDEFYKRYPLRITSGSMSGFNQRVFHGTPNQWAQEPGFPNGRPRLDRIGSGEGNKAQGWGWYSAELKEVADMYAEGGRTLELDIPDQYADSLLLWDMKLSAQPENVSGALKDFDQNIRGRDAYKALSEKLGSDKAASDYLAERGVVGSQYIDNSVKVGGRRPTNYVIWSQPVLDGMSSAPAQVFNQSKVQDEKDLIVYHNLTEANLMHASFTLASEFVDGRKVLSNVPNTSSISASLNEYDALQGIREVPFSAFPDMGDLRYYSPEEEQRTKLLARAIKNSGEISPLIVVVDEQGPYILEGAHRFDALRELGASSFPALVVLDTESRSDSGTPLYQENRGSFDPRTLTISLLKGADLTTVIHESGHFFLDALADIASRPDAPESVAKDFKTVMAWFGVEESAWSSMSLEQKRPYHEQWAESYERFTMEGKAPTTEMQPVFTRFRTWMLSVYKSVEQFVAANPDAGKLNDDIRAVFGRMLASEEVIGQTETDRGYAALFASADEAGMSEDAYAEYVQQGQDATDDAVTEMQKRSLRDMKWLSGAKNRAIKALQAEADDKRDVILADVTEEVMSEPINVLRLALKDKENPLKLHTGTLKELIPGFDARDLRGMTHAEDGVHPDQVADMFGFQSGVEMVNSLLSSESADKKINGITDQRMLEQHGELIDERAIQQAANEAVHNEGRAKFLATGLSILTKSGMQSAPLNKAATEAAKSAVSAKRVRDLKPKQYDDAEKKANKAAIQKAPKDPQGAIKAQRAALLNNRLAKAATDALDEVDQGVARMARLRKSAAQGNMRGEFLEQLNLLMERFDLRTSRSLKQIDAERTPLATWLESESDRLSAVMPAIPGWVLHEDTRKHYKDLTVEEFRGLMEAVKALELLARREEHQYQEIRGMNFSAERKAILDRIQSRHPEAFTVDGEPKGMLADFIPKMVDFEKLGEKFVGEFVNAENIISILEGGEFGQIHESLFGRMSDGVNKKAAMLASIYKDMRVKFKAYSVAERLAFSRKDIGAINGTRITRENAVVIALLHGSADGRERLANYGWGEAAQVNVIGLLEARDLDLVDAIWSTGDNVLWPQLKELNERTRGKSPPKVEAVPFTVNGRVMTGGYARLKYDTNLDERAQRFDETAGVTALLGGTMGSGAKTAQGTSTERKDGVTMRPRLDLGVFAESVAETVHDITMREAVADTMRLLNDKGIQNVIKTTAGTAAYRALVTRVREVAAPPMNPSGFIENALSIARKNTIVTLMSGLGTAIQNVTGFASSAARVNPGALVKEIAAFAQHPIKRAEFCYSQSGYMENRHSTFDRDLADQVKKLTVNGGILPDTAQMLFLLGWVDRAVSIPTWNAAFKDGMDKFANDRKQAVDYADHVVRQTQGSGRDVDVAKIMAGHGGMGQLKKIFTMFYSYFNAQLGMLVRSGAINKQLAKTNPALAVAQFTRDFILVFAIPAILTKMVFFGNAEDDFEEDEWLQKYMLAMVSYGMAMIPLVRDVGSYAVSELTGLTTNYGLKVSPVESAAVGVVKGLGAVGDIVKGEGTDKDTKDVIMGVSYAAGLPGALVSKTVMGTKALIEGEAEPKAIIYGPPPAYYKED